MATCSAEAVAAEIRKRLPGVGAKKLHKLLYYAQGHHLAMFGEPLFSETISAWDMGPVVGQLWNAEREGRTLVAEAGGPGEAGLNSIGYVLARYGGLSGFDLERLTHSERPWQDADAERQRGGRRSARLELDVMREYFSTEGNGDERDEPEVHPSDADVRKWLDSSKERTRQEPSPDTRDSLTVRRR